MRKFTVILATLLILAACSMLGAITDNAVSLVDRYCELHLAEREQIRLQVNSALKESGHRIYIDCAGDVP